MRRLPIEPWDVIDLLRAASGAREQKRNVDAAANVGCPNSKPGVGSGGLATSAAEPSLGDLNRDVTTGFDAEDYPWPRGRSHEECDRQAQPRRQSSESLPHVHERISHRTITMQAATLPAARTAEGRRDDDRDEAPFQRSRHPSNQCVHRSRREWPDGPQCRRGSHPGFGPASSVR